MWELARDKHKLVIVKIGTHEGTSRVPATSRGDKSHRVNWPFLLQNLVASRDQSLVPATSPTNSDQFEFLGQVPATCFSKRFM